MTTAMDRMVQIRARVKSIYDYPDVLQVWVPDPFPAKDLHVFKAHSDSLWRAGHFGIREPARWNHRYRQFLRLCQPDEEAVELFAKQNEVKITYLELTRDVVFDEEEDVLALKRLIASHFVQPRHRTRQATVFLETENYRTSELYDDKGRPKPGVNFQSYDIPSKLTGEWSCLHIEMKVTGSAACRRLGIDHPTDLIGFNYDALWNQHLVLCEVDRERFGRRLRNKANKTWCKTSAITKSGYNADRAAGNLMCRLFGFDDDYNKPFSMQRLVDQIGMRELCLVRFSMFQKDKAWSVR